MFRDVKGGANRAGLIFLILLILFLGLIISGCARWRQAHVDISRSHVKNTQAFIEGTQNFLVAWAGWSGAIWGGLRDRKAELPDRAIEALEELDRLSALCVSVNEALRIGSSIAEARSLCNFSDWEPKLDIEFPYTGEKRTEFGSGFAVGCTVVMCYEVVIAAFKEFAPDILKMVPILAL